MYLPSPGAGTGFTAAALPVTPPQLPRALAASLETHRTRSQSCTQPLISPVLTSCLTTHPSFYIVSSSCLNWPPQYPAFCESHSQEFACLCFIRLETKHRCKGPVVVITLRLDPAHDVTRCAEPTLVCVAVLSRTGKRRRCGDQHHHSQAGKPPASLQPPSVGRAALPPSMQDRSAVAQRGESKSFQLSTFRVVFFFINYYCDEKML